MTDQEDETDDGSINLQKYKDAGIKRIEVDYAGGGDDGCIDEVTVIEGSGELTPKMKDDIEELIYNILQDMPDWCNNEGGYGHAYLNVERDLIRLDHNVYYDESKIVDQGYNDEHVEGDGADEALVELRRLFKALPENISRILYNAQYDEASSLAFVDASGRRVKEAVADENRILEILDELCEDALNYTDEYNTDNDEWYNFDVIFNRKNDEFDRCDLKFTVRDEEGTTTWFKMSNGECTDAPEDDYEN